MKKVQEKKRQATETEINAFNGKGMREDKRIPEARAAAKKTKGKAIRLIRLLDFAN